MHPGVFFAAAAVAAIGIPRLVGVFVRRWFDDVEAMDEDYPTIRSEPTSPAAGGGAGGFHG